MDVNTKEENLREAASNGDLEVVQEIVQSGVNINSRNAINGWTALHWAARRGQKHVLSYLLAQGADKNVVNKQNETAAEITDDASIHRLLRVENITANVPKLPITPHYLSHPEYSSKAPLWKSNGEVDARSAPELYKTHYNYGVQYANELVLKVRVANSDDTDFYEVELDRTSLTYDALLSLMCAELRVDKNHVHKIRKLPDTVLRKDKDVKRLVDLQELELVLTHKSIIPASRCYGMNSTKTHDRQILY